MQLCQSLISKSSKNLSVLSQSTKVVSTAHGFKIPNALMCKWYEGCKDGKGLLKALNMTILDKCVAIREDRIRFSEQLEGVAVKFQLSVST